MTQKQGKCAYMAPVGEFPGVCGKARHEMLNKLRAHNEQNALDALKRAITAKNHELYQFELERAEEYIKAAMDYKGDDR